MKKYLLFCLATLFVTACSNNDDFISNENMTTRSATVTPRTTNILGVQVPGPFKTTEVCHELSIYYSLAATGRADKCEDGLLNTTTFTQHLLSKTPTTGGQGKIATFWVGNVLTHSMVVGGNNSWCGSNNLNSFGVLGNRVWIDVSSKLKNNGTQLQGLYDLYNIRYFTVNDVASYIKK